MMHGQRNIKKTCFGLSLAIIRFHLKSFVVRVLKIIANYCKLLKLLQLLQLFQ